MAEFEPQTCRTCAHWNAGAPALATAARRIEPTTVLGACEHAPPAVICGPGYGPKTLYPETHGDRSCGWWTSRDEPVEDGVVVPFRLGA